MPMKHNRHHRQIVREEVVPGHEEELVQIVHHSSHKKHRNQKVVRESTSTETEVVETHLPKKKRVKHVVQE